MRKRLLIIAILLAAITPLMAEKRPSTEPSYTGDEKIDSLIISLNRREQYYEQLGIGKLRFDAIVHGASLCTHNNWFSKVISDILPFDWREKQHDFEALIQGSYQHPCELLITPVSVFSNSRRSRKALREIKQIIMPLDGISIMNDAGSNKSFVSPFSDDGINQYSFSVNEEGSVDEPQTVVVHFSPKRRNHTLIEGDAWIDPDKQIVKKMIIQGLIDFGQINDTIYYKKEGAPYIDRSTLCINYRYGRTRGTNYFDCIYNIEQYETLEETDARPKNFDLTDVYQTYKTQYLELPETTFDRGSTASDTTQHVPDSVSSDNSIIATRSTYRDALERLPKQLFGRNYFNAFGTEVRVNGPLNPTSIGYDKHNGITFREQIRFSKTWDNGERLLFNPEIGYSFGYHQFRYKVALNWLFKPSRRASLSITSRNRASGFSSKFKEAVDQSIKDQQDRFEKDKKNPWKKEMGFDDLELYFFHHYETNAEISYEIANGLMLYGGAFYNYRTPERHGTRSISEDQFELLVKEHYADLNPFIRLEYTPQQYYYFKNGYKQYLASRWPTFTFEAAQGIYGWFGSTSNYTRLELDVQQNIRIGANRSLSYHIGSGAFYRQNGEYFINYHYFARSQYPSTWEEKIGGSFSLLNDYWYCSSPAYHQAHVMYESPFLLLNKIPAISKYVIKERLYLGHLIADGKNSYTEFGYGIGNNYFNIGAFGSMIGLKMWDAGIKFTIEIDQHL